MTPAAPRDLARAAALLRFAAALERPLAGSAARLTLGARLPLGAAGALRCDLLLAFGGGAPDAARTVLVASVGDARRRDALLAVAAAAALPEAWHLEAAAGWLERHRAPAGGRYRLRDLHWPGDRLALPAGLGELRVPNARPKR